MFKSLLDKIKNKKAQIGIIGLGYVGLPLAREFLNKGFKVIGFDIDIEKVNFKNPFLIDAIISLGVTKALFNEVDYNLINAYTIDPHKLEELKDTKNRLWIDDSKATNPDATIQALKTYQNKKIHLILGGDDKGANLEPLFDKLVEIKPTVYCIGKNANKIFEFCESKKIDTILCGFLEVAVSKIDKNLKKDEIALLSPAASSLDEFNSYAHRGDEFKKAVQTVS